MKSLFSVAGLSVGVLGCFFAQAVQAAPGEIFRKTAQLRLQEATPDDYLIELGRAADLNIVADVTQPPIDNPLLTVNGRKAVAGFVNDLVGSREMLGTPFDQKTMLFWTAPNFGEIQQMIRAEQENVAKTRLAPLAAEDTSRRWQEYLRQAQQWNGKWEEADIKVAVNDLPADLRLQVQQELERRIGEGRMDSLAQRRASDEFWAKGRLYITPISPAPRTRPLPHLVLWDFTQVPFPAPKSSTGINIILGPLPGQVVR